MTNRVTVNGTVTVKAVSANTFDNYAETGTIIVNGHGAVNDQQSNPAPVVIDVPEGTTVTVKGDSRQISVVSDGAKLTVATETAPKVESTAQTVELTVNTTQPVTVAGTVDTVKAAVAEPTLKVDGTVKTVDAPSASALKVEGTGAIGTVNSGSAAVEVKSDELSVETVAAENGGSLKAPANTVSEVKAQGSVTLNAPVETVTAEAGTVLTLGESAEVKTVEAKGSLTLGGTGTVSSVDVQTDTAAIAVSESAAVTVGQVTTTAENTQNITVTVPNQTIEVQTKAAKPENIMAYEPETLPGNGTITGVDDSMEYASAADGSGWQEISGTSLSLPAGTYQVRVKAQGARLASESVTVTIPASVGVTSGTVQGTLHVGQTLTASANADATGTISYEWKAGDTVVGTAKTLTLADEYAGKIISVTVSNYGGAASHTITAGTVIVDKTALGKLLGKAAEIRKGVSVKDAEASAVAEGIVFVSTEKSQALATAVEAGNAAYVDTANTQTVSAAESGLRTAIADYTAAKKTGTNNEVQTLQNDLSALLAAAPQVVKTAESAEIVTPGAQWTTEAAKTAYTTAWTDANGKTASTDAAELRQAISDLNAAITAYTKAIRLGAQLDNSALTAAITAAELNAASVTVSVNGTDVLPSENWVPQSVLDTYTTAIDGAKNVTATVQKNYTDALSTLNRETDNFNGAKAAGSKVVAEHIHTFTCGTDWTTLNSARTCSCGESQPIADTFYITSIADLAAFRDAVNAGTDFAGKTVCLMTDITLVGEWTPIGNTKNLAFKGTFDGGYKTISNLTINGTDKVGLFGFISEGAVKNVTIANAAVATTGATAGILAAELRGVQVENVTVSGTVSSACYTGGVIGSLVGGSITKDTVIKNCVNNAAVITGNTGNTECMTGGIVGYASTRYGNTLIENCTNAGSVTQNSGYGVGAGGIVGFLTSESQNTSGKTAAVKNCTNSGAVSGTGNVGGIGGAVGYSGGVAASDMPVLTAAFTDCINTGTVSLGTKTDNICGAKIHVNGTDASSHQIVINYTTEEIPVTAANAQDYLDGKCGSIDGKTLVLAAGNYDTLYLRQTPDASARRVDLDNDTYYKAYYREFNDVTIKAAEGANVTCDGIKVEAGLFHFTNAPASNQGAMGDGFISYLPLRNITIEGITFNNTGSTAVVLRASSAGQGKGSDLYVNGFTVKNCKGTGTTANTAQHFFSAGDGSSDKTFCGIENGVKGLNNLSIIGCEITSYYQPICFNNNSAILNGLTVSGNTFTSCINNIAQISNKYNCGAFTFSGNTLVNMNGRFVRMANAQSDAVITFDNTTVTAPESYDSVQEPEIIKITGVEGFAVSSNGNSGWTIVTNDATKWVANGDTSILTAGN